MSDQVEMSFEDVKAAADLIEKAFPGLKVARALTEHTAIAILRRGMLAERKARAGMIVNSAPNL